MKKAVLFLFSVFLFVCGSLISIEANQYNNDEFEEKRVLFISSYSSAFPTFFEQINGLKDTFENYPIILDVEFMDSKRFFNEENLSLFKELITYKLSMNEYDLIMTSDDNAINFVMENRTELFNDLPIIFFGVNNEANAELYAGNDLVTGVVEDISIKETIDFALSLNPKATNVIGLFDATPSGQSDLVRYYELQDSFDGITLNKIDMNEMSMDNFLLELGEVNEQSVLILFSALRDSDNISYEFNDSLEMMLSVSNQPIYHLFEHGIPEGLIGGKVVSHYSQGATAADMALQVFNGEDIKNISLVSESPNVYKINYEVFESYGYDEKLLPDGTIFINREYTLFERYTELIMGIIIFLIFQTLIIAALVINVRYKNKAKKEVDESNTHLEQALKDVEAANNLLVYRSFHDDLTGLYNRNYFEEQYPQLKNLDEPMEASIVLMDINGLKLINDAFGHMAGDRILKETASLLREIFKDSEIFRIGGDEFAIIPFGKKEITVQLLINKVNKEIKKIKVGGVSASVSVGYAFVTEDKTLREIFTEAEDWMYREKLNQVPSNRSSIIEAIIATINQKDVYSENHSKRVSEIAVKIAGLLKLSDNQINQIKTAGLLHDIGKIIVPTHILNKEGRLTEDEFDEIKKHSEIGYRILNSVSSMREIAELVFCHHERPDGKGYPRGLKNDMIPLESRIIALADALDAMLTDRLYRDKIEKDKCLLELKENQGTQFCFKTTEVVIEHYDEIHDFIVELQKQFA